MASDLIPGGLNMKLLSNFLVPIFTSFVYMLYLSDLVYLCIQNFLAHQSVSAIFFSYEGFPS